MMKRTFKIEKIPLDTLINLLIELYESGIDYVDLSSDNSNPEQDKLIIQSKDSYINPKFNAEDRKGFREEEDDDDEEDNFLNKTPPTIETRKLTDEDLNNLI